MVDPGQAKQRIDDHAGRQDAPRRIARNEQVDKLRDVAEVARGNDV